MCDTTWDVLPKQAIETALRERLQNVKALRQAIRDAINYDRPLSLPLDPLEAEYHIAAMEDTCERGLGLLRSSPGEQYWDVGPLWHSWPNPIDRAAMEAFAGRPYVEGAHLVLNPRKYLRPHPLQTNIWQSQVIESGASGLQVGVSKAGDRER